MLLRGTAKVVTFLSSEVCMTVFDLYVLFIYLSIHKNKLKYFNKKAFYCYLKTFVEKLRQHILFGVG